MQGTGGISKSNLSVTRSLPSSDSIDTIIENFKSGRVLKRNLESAAGQIKNLPLFKENPDHVKSKLEARLEKATDDFKNNLTKLNEILFPPRHSAPPLSPSLSDPTAFDTSIRNELGISNKPNKRPASPSVDNERHTKRQKLDDSKKKQLDHFMGKNSSFRINFLKADPASLQSLQREAYDNTPGIFGRYCFDNQVDPKALWQLLENQADDLKFNRAALADMKTAVTESFNKLKSKAEADVKAKEADAKVKEAEQKKILAQINNAIPPIPHASAYDPTTPSEGVHSDRLGGGGSVVWDHDTTPPYKILQAWATITSKDIGTGQKSSEGGKNHMTNLGSINGIDNFGHIIARSLGGPGTWGNGFPQHENVNSDKFEKFEQGTVKKGVDDFGEIEVYLKFNYSDSKSLDRPSQIDYHVFHRGGGFYMLNTFPNPRS